MLPEPAMGRHCVWYAQDRCTGHVHWHAQDTDALVCIRMHGMQVQGNPCVVCTGHRCTGMHRYAQDAGARKCASRQCGKGGRDWKGMWAAKVLRTEHGDGQTASSGIAHTHTHHTNAHTAHLQRDHTLELALAVVGDARGLVQRVRHQRVLHGVHERGPQLVVLDLDQVIQAGNSWQPVTVKHKGETLIVGVTAAQTTSCSREGLTFCSMKHKAETLIVGVTLIVNATVAQTTPRSWKMPGCLQNEACRCGSDGESTIKRTSCSRECPAVRL
eukprot:1161635-Pelagomonas_calceolata.AAC.17